MMIDEVEGASNDQIRYEFFGKGLKKVAVPVLFQ